MIVVSSLFALIFGFSLGFVFDNTLILAVVACIAPCFFWVFKLYSQWAHVSEPIHSNSLPVSIFKSEFDDVEFTDDRERSSRKRTVSASMSYIVGLLIGGLIAPIISTNL